MKSIVVLTGAGISAESGLGTFTDSSGLWEKYKIEDVATPEAFKKKPSLVLDFYNIRRRELIKSSPNKAHTGLNKLQEKFNLDIITQNIDDLHERSGTTNVLHLHGKLTEVITKAHNPESDKGFEISPLEKKEINEAITALENKILKLKKAVDIKKI